MERETDMREGIALLAMRMTEYEAGCPQRINHFLKVYAFAREIGILTGLGWEEQQALEAAALTHDIGIKESLKKYGSAAGKHQEQEGPGIAAPMMEALGFPPSIIERVCYLIAHHHTYSDVQGMDYQILVEADFLVNIWEGNMAREEITGVRDKIFQTQAGKTLLTNLFLSEKK